MVIALKKSAGVTLIEIAIVLVLLAILATVGVSYGSAWIANSKISTANSNLNVAYRKAVSLALQNPDGVIEDGVAASLAINSGVIQARRSNNTVFWSSNLPQGVEIKLHASCANTIELNNHGLPINSVCIEYEISAQGGSSVNAKLN